MDHGGRAIGAVRRRAGAAFALLLATAGLAVAGGSPAVAEDRPAVAAGPSAGAVLVRQTVTLDEHASGFPLPGTAPGRRLSKVEVAIDAFGQTSGDPSYSVDVFVDLQATPDTGYDDDAQVVVALGHREGRAGCAPSHIRRERTSGRKGGRYHVFGYTPDYWGGTPDRPWECVLVAVATLDGTTVDGMGGFLTNQYERPEIRIGAVRLLGKSPKKLRLVRNTWTTVQVDVDNSGPARSPEMTLRASGKGLKVRRAKTSLGRLGTRSGTTVALQVRPTKKKAGPLRLTVSGGGVDARRTVRIQATTPPPRPRAGRYRSTDGSVSFRIRNGRVVGFNARMQTRCGGFGSPPTYTQNTYDFPRTKIPRNGIVQASRRGKALGNTWSTHLQMQVKGAKVTHGRFSYGTAGPCTAMTGFTARRIGR